MLKQKQSTLDDNLSKLSRTFAAVSGTDIIQRRTDAIGRLHIAAKVLQDTHDKLKEEFKHSDERANILLGVSTIYNRTASVLDLASTKELQREEANTYVAKCIKHAARVKQLVGELRAKEQAKLEVKNQQLAAEYGGADKLQRSDKVIDIINKAGPTIQHYQKYASMMPHSAVDAKKKFIILRAPVVAITNPIVSAEEYDKGGFTSTPVGFYSVIENQLIVGVNALLLKDQQINVEEFRKFVLETAGHKMNTRLITLGKPIGYKNSGYSFSWVIPEKELDHFRSMTHKVLTPTEWGWAFK